MGEIRTFRDDDILKPLLDAIPKKKRSRIYRRALYDYFFKGEDKSMSEDDDSYIANETKVEIDATKKVEKIEMNFNMFDD